MDTPVRPEIILLGQFGFDRHARRLFRCGEGGAQVPVNVGSRALDVLTVMLDRSGELVTKDEMMAAVWPDTVVDGANLTVQISALRRVLDEDRVEGSYILTIPGRGYRFVGCPPRIATNQPEAEEDATENRPAAPEDPLDRPAGARRSRLRFAGAGFALVVVAAIGGAFGYKWYRLSPTYPPLSIVVLPFENLSSDRGEDYLTDAITDDLTTDLSHIRNALVIARASAYTYKDKVKDVRNIGADLGVRYVVTGSVRNIGSTLRVNVHVTSTETDADLWSDRFDEQISDLATGQEEIGTRMRVELGFGLIEIEEARSLRERPTNPDAFDLILRARFIMNHAFSPQRFREGCGLYEQALILDPLSDSALAMIASCLIWKNPEVTNGNAFWSAFDDKGRAAQLLAKARTIAPDSEEMLGVTLSWLLSQGRCQEEIALGHQLIDRFPNNAVFFRMLADCEVMTGHSEEAIPLLLKAIQLNPRTPDLHNRYAAMGSASLWLGRDEDAIGFLQQAVALEGDSNGSGHWLYTWLGAAYGRLGRIDEAKHALAEASRLWPYDTVRSHWPDFAISDVFADQIRHYQDGLRLAGERDHADEDADFGVPSDRELHSALVGFTPRDAPGAMTIRTADLPRLLADARPVVIDAMTDSWGRSIPGAVELVSVGSGGSLTDSGQDHLKSKMHDLTGDDLNKPIVAVGWNSERFDGRNLALRLVALGYTRVYWYRGGREAWQVAGLPETEISPQDW